MGRGGLGDEEGEETVVEIQSKSMNLKRVHLYIKVQSTLTCISKCKQKLHEIGARGDSLISEVSGSQL